ncbi:MAG: hypothetical protein LBT38_11305 [Deltaproteobacteria bacterium]|jgi:hypothetical protein|nr:hypothetical protein [Deltaproteobacteria bacterium]
MRQIPPKFYVALFLVGIFFCLIATQCMSGQVAKRKETRPLEPEIEAIERGLTPANSEPSKPQTPEIPLPEEPKPEAISEEAAESETISDNPIEAETHEAQQSETLD